MRAPGIAEYALRTPGSPARKAPPMNLPKVFCVPMALSIRTVRGRRSSAVLELLETMPPFGDLVLLICCVPRGSDGDASASFLQPGHSTSDEAVIWQSASLQDQSFALYAHPTL